jgi:hypothetical protein
LPNIAVKATFTSSVAATAIAGDFDVQHHTILIAINPHLDNALDLV